MLNLKLIFCNGNEARQETDHIYTKYAKHSSTLEINATVVQMSAGKLRTREAHIHWPGKLI